MAMAMPNPADVRAAFANQVAYCRANGAPITARVCEAFEIALDRSTDFGARVLGWRGDPLADALPLRCAGGLHALHLSGTAPEIAPLYAPVAIEIEQSSMLLAYAIAAHEPALLPWLASAPQTNEAGRSANFIAALLWLADRGLPPRFALNEIGSSAGVNLMLARYRYTLGGVSVGPENAPVVLAPEWRGSPQPDRAIDLVSARGCDVAPVDLSDPAQADRLRAYIWPEHTERFARLDAAIDCARDDAPEIVAADAADFVDAILAAPQDAGTTRVLMHSIVWQYLPQASRKRITAAMTGAGARATADRPLAWISLEANRENFRHELRVRHWPDGGANRTWLGSSHAHGRWIDWNPPIS